MEISCINCKKKYSDMEESKSLNCPTCRKLFNRPLIEKFNNVEEYSDASFLLDKAVKELKNRLFGYVFDSELKTLSQIELEVGYEIEKILGSLEQ